MSITTDRNAAYALAMSPPSINVTACDPDQGVHCDYCGAEICDGQVDVVLMNKAHALVAFCGPVCANRDIRESRKLVETRGEKTPF